jgi:formylglycine-generating enzyme required for sulfatase activity/tRNA A-37 threonylcarbamoyl transferase component Bud32
MSLYCLNPACASPNNPNTHKYCHGCGQQLSQTTIGYQFRDRYNIIQVLGEGNFGRTYLVEDQNFSGRKRVLKKFIATFQGKSLETAKELFKREAEILDTLKHEQIPAIYDHFEEENSLYLVEEYIEGEDLITEFEREGNFTEEKIKSLLQDLLPVLDYLHQRNLLHRDIKPDNIMRRRHDGKLVLIDFGGVKEVSKTRGTLIYTPGYGSIEQMNGHPQPASDIYSLGATCVRLLTGCFPSDNEPNDPIYDSNNATWLWQDFLQNQGQKIDKNLGNILDKMLQNLAQDRYKNTQEILQELNQPLASSQPLIIPQPASLSEVNRISKPHLTVNNLLKNQKILIYSILGSSSIVSIWLIKSLVYKSSSEFLLLWERLLNYAALMSIFIIFICLGKLLISLFKNASKKKISPTTLQTSNVEIEAPSIPTSIPTSAPSVAPLSTPTKTPNKNLISSLKPFQFEVIKVDNTGKIIEREIRKNQYFTVELGQDIYLEMVLIPGGKFFMGCPQKESRDRQQETPQHWVTLASFCMSKYPITQAQWESIMIDNPSYFKGKNRPVENVSLYDCLDFCEKLSQTAGINLTIPSEAQWEYACRGIINSHQYKQLDGTEIYPPFHFGETITQALANYNCTRTYQQESIGIDRKETTDVGSFSPNAFGLYDLHGNVWEWCADTWHQTYNNAPIDGSIWLEGNDKNSPMRGGSWAGFPFYCRCATRNKVDRNNRSYYNGFRVVYNFKKKS